MRYIKLFEDLIRDRSLPEHYTQFYDEAEKEKFMMWYKKIEPYLYDGDERGAQEVLINFEEECLVKFDLYCLLKSFFEKNRTLFTNKIQKRFKL